MRSIKIIIFILLCTLPIVETFGQTKKVVRQTKQAPVTQKSTSAKTTTAKSNAHANSNTSSSNKVGFVVDGLRYLFSSPGVALCESSKVSGNVVIPKEITYNGRKYSVTRIGVRAFYDCRNLTSVTIPESVTVIEDFAFLGCSKLTSVTIPNSVRNIGYGAFMGCDGLTSVSVPNSVTNLNAKAFPSTTKVTRVSSQSSGNNMTAKKPMTEEEQLESLLLRANEYAANSSNKENRKMALRLYLEYLTRGKDKKKKDEVSKKISEVVSENKEFVPSSQYLRGESNGNYSIMDMLLHPLLHFPTITNGQTFKEMHQSVERQYSWKLNLDSKYNIIRVYDFSNKNNMPHINGVECYNMDVKFLKKNDGRYFNYVFKFPTQDEADKFYYDVCMIIADYKMSVKRAGNYNFLEFDIIHPVYSMKKRLNQDINVFFKEKEVSIQVNQYFYKM